MGRLIGMRGATGMKDARLWPMDSICGIALSHEWRDVFWFRMDYGDYVRLADAMGRWARDGTVERLKKEARKANNENL